MATKIRSKFRAILRPRWITAVAVLALQGCATTDLKVPKVERGEVESARNEIRQAPMVTNTYVTTADADQRLATVYANIAPAARTVCTRMGEDECIWNLQLADEGELNAYATGESKVVIFKGLFNYAKTEDEAAFVVAHELGHHIADHINETRTNATAGALLGGLLVGVAVAASSGPYDPYAQQRASDAMRSGMELGGAIGSLSFSVAQEKEADFLATQIVREAGYEPLAARGIFITMAKISDNTGNTGFLASHPAGPERLATFDSLLFKGFERDADGKLAFVDLRDRHLPDLEQGPLAPPQSAVASTGDVPPALPRPTAPETSAPAIADPVEQSAQVALAPVSVLEPGLGARSMERRQLDYEFDAQRLASSVGCSPSIQLLTKEQRTEIYRAQCERQEMATIKCEFGNCEFVE